jgi:5-methylcytosine-specific restriction endonuclease McrA
MKTYAEKLKHPKWQKKRLEVLQLSNFTCEWCGETEKTLHVHHFFYKKGANPWEYDNCDLVSICEDCHYIHHSKVITSQAKEIFQMCSILDAKYSGIAKDVKNMILEIINRKDA